jgi:hypothetical protein
VAVSACGNSPAAFYFLFDTTCFRRISATKFPHYASEASQTQITNAISLRKYRNQSSKPLRQSNKLASQNGAAAGESAKSGRDFA